MSIKKLILVILIITGLLIISCKNKTADDTPETAEPKDTSVCVIDGKQIPFEDFRKEYSYYLKLNYSQGRQEILREDKEEMKKYFQSQFLPQFLFQEYAEKLEIFKDKDFLKQVKDNFKMSGLIQYATFLNVNNKYKEPNDELLKTFFNELQQSPEAQIKEVVKNMKGLPWDRQRIGVLELHRRFHTNKATLEYIEKIRQENRLIINDDLEENLINKYINDKIPMDKILNDPDKKLWVIKFNNTIVSAGDIEQQVRILIQLNSGKEQLEKYLNNKETRISFRKLIWSNVNMQWLIYLQAVKKKYADTEDGKFFIDASIRSSMSKVYISINIAAKIEEPTDKEIKETYNKLKEKNPQAPAMNAEVKDYIKMQLKQQKAQQEMMKFFERLKGRHVIITNEKYFGSAETAPVSTPQR